MQHSALPIKLLLTLRQIFMIIGVILFIFVVVALMSRTATPAMAHDVHDPQPEVHASAR